MAKKLEKTIIKIIQDKLKTKKKITLKSGPYSVKNWDSLKHVDIILKLSKKFKLKLSENDYEMLFDVESIVNFIQNNEKK